MSEFPADDYSTAQKKWIGIEHIVLPSIQNVLKNGDLIRNKRVLDAGCGTGHYAKRMLEWGAESVFGVDASAEMIAECKETYKGISKLSFEHVPLEDLAANEEFDVAVCIFVLQFIETRECLSKIFENIARALRPGSLFVALVPNAGPDFNPVVEEGYKFGGTVTFDRSKPLSDGDSATIEFYDAKKLVGSSKIRLYFKETLAKYLEENGFSEIQFASPVISSEGIAENGAEFFESYLNPPNDIFIMARKSI